MRVVNDSISQGRYKDNKISSSLLFLTYKIIFRMCVYYREEERQIHRDTEREKEMKNKP